MRSGQNLLKKQLRINQQSHFSAKMQKKTNESDCSQMLSPKFNRKQQIRAIEHRKKHGCDDQTERLCFISPGRMNLKCLDDSTYGENSFCKNSMTTSRNTHMYHTFNHAVLVSSPKAHQMADSVLSLFSETENPLQLNHSPTSPSPSDQLHQKLQAEIQELQSQNKIIKEKAQEFELIKQFLFERERYISDLSQRNLELEIALTKKQGEIKSLRNEMKENSIKLNERDQKIQKLEVFQNKIEQQNQAMQQNLQKYKKEESHFNRKLCDNKVSLLKETTNNLLKNKTNYRSSQNLNPKLEDGNSLTNILKKTNIFKKNSPSSVYQNLNEIIECCSRQTINSSKKIERKNQQRKHSCFTTYEDAENILNQSIIQEQTNISCVCQGQEIHQIIKKFNEKLKYKQIEIDILRKIKLDADKIKLDNDKIKKQNKKLLTKIEDLLKKEEKVSRSNTSLDLSLSPKKR